MSKEHDEGQFGDAFALFVGAKEEATKQKGGRVFASGEHIWLGQAGAVAACQERKTSVVPFTRIRRKQTGHVFSYGELVALSGDFYGSPEDLFDEKPASLPWMWQANNIDKLREAFAVELGWLERQRRGEAVALPEQSVALAWHAKSYVELAIDNNSHFGWHNMKAYVEYHGRAIKLAITAKAQLAAGSEDGEQTWLRAVFTNAFADHFLTDAFAAGHVRTPRSQVRALGKERGWSDKLAGILAKLLHDQDGHLETFHSHGEGERSAKDGLHVTNDLGVDWYTRCDGQLFIAQDDTSDPLVGQPVEAVKKSVLELLAAKNEGVTPDGVYAATHHAPFPHAEEKSLADKFPAAMPDTKVDALFKSVEWYSMIPWVGPGMERKHIVELFEILPDLMARFRQDVKADVAADPELVRRLPEAYISAFENIA